MQAPAPFEPYVYSIDEQRVTINVAMVVFLVGVSLALAWAVAHGGGPGLRLLGYISVFLFPLAIIVLQELRHPRRIELTSETLTVHFWHRSGWTHEMKRVDVKPSDSGVRVFLRGDDDTNTRSFQVPKSYPEYFDLNEMLGHFANDA